MGPGFGPGIDYGAIGEAMAMGEAIASWRRVAEQAEAEVERANAIIDVKARLVANLQAQIAELDNRLARAEGKELETHIAAQGARHELKTTTVALERVQSEAKVAELKLSSSRNRETALRSDLETLCTHAAGMAAMLVALVAALEAAAPEHALLQPTEGAGPDGEPKAGIDPIYDDAMAAMARKLELALPESDLFSVAQTITARAVRARANQPVTLSEKLIFG